MDISNKKLKKALENYNMGQYEAALKHCEKLLEKEYSNEEALYLEGEILYKLNRVDDAIVTWKINAEYNNNQEAIDHLNNVDKDKRERALSYTNIQNMGEEIQKALMESERQKKESLANNSQNDESLSNNNENNEINQVQVNELKSIKEETIITEIPTSIKEETIITEIPVSIKEETITTEIPTLSKNSSDQIEETIDESNILDSPFTEPVQEEVPPTDAREYVVVDSDIDDVMSITRSHSKPVLPDPDIDLEELKNRIKHLEGNQNKEDDTTKENLHNKTVDSIMEETASSKTSKKPSKKVIITTVVVAAVVVVAISYSGLSSKTNSSKHKPTVTSADKTEAKPTPKPEVKPAEPEIKKPAVLNEADATALSTNMQYLLSVNSVDGLNTVLTNTPKDTVPESIMPEYNKVADYMKTTGLNYYYENGMNSYNQGNYLDAIEYFKKGLPYATEAYRGPSMAYLIGASYYKLDDYTQSMDAFKKFLDTYPNSDSYTAEVMYNLAMYYNTHGDKEQAKKYATMLTEKQSSSMYNNTNIKDIINEK